MAITWPKILLAVGAVVAVVAGVLVFRDPESRNASDDAPGPGPARILSLLGARGRAGATEKSRTAYRRIFARLDADGDGRHSHEEYVTRGVYLNAQARAGIFRAADNDRDGFVTEAEYVENRIITDEAKAIVLKMDRDGDGRVTSREFVEHSGIDDPDLAAQIFGLLDTNEDDEIRPPEYLRVWVRWARTGRGDGRGE